MIDNEELHQRIRNHVGTALIFTTDKTSKGELREGIGAVSDNVLKEVALAVRELPVVTIGPLAVERINLADVLMLLGERP